VSRKPVWTLELPPTPEQVLDLVNKRAELRARARRLKEDNRFLRENAQVVKHEARELIAERRRVRDVSSSPTAEFD
jgi:hypothetical protein